jgi:uncharacterized protein (DUF1778 family)
MEETTTADKLLFTLDDEGFEQFVASFDALPVKSEELARLFAVQPPWAHERAPGGAE